MRHRTGYGYRPPKPRFTDRNGRPAIDDFPLVPEPPQYIIPPPAIQSGPVVSTAEPSLSRLPALSAANMPRAESRGANEVSRGAQPQPQPEVPPAPETLDPPFATEAAPAETDSVSDGDIRTLVSLVHSARKVLEAPRLEQRRPPARKPRKKIHRGKSKSRATRVSSPAPSSPRNHHERHCSVCNHPEREAIEEEFIHWHIVAGIAHDYGVEARAIYRHAHATGLFDRRGVNVRFALAHIIENAERVDPTADAVIRAVRAFTRVNHQGQWIEPPAHVIVSSGNPTRIAVPLVPSGVEGSEHREPRGGAPMSVEPAAIAVSECPALPVAESTATLPNE